MNDWTVLTDVDQFRRVKRSGVGVVVIRDSASTTIHHPKCPHVREDAFLEKLRNGRLGYHWTTSVDVARDRWPSARPCRHPSDPLAGDIGRSEVRRHEPAPTAPRSGSGWSVEGPSPTLPAVRASADFALPYEPRTPAHREMRAELRERLRRLTSRDDEVLHASFSGPKPANADVENLVLYNVDDSGGAFGGAAGGGVRFELSPEPLPNAARTFTYVYRPVHRSDGFELWTEPQTVAYWPAVTLARPGDRAAVWLAFRTTLADLGVRHTGQFGVRVRLRHDASANVRAVRLIKPLFDGIIAALQSHGDPSTLVAVSERVAAATGSSAAAIAALLGDTSASALGTVGRLVHLRSQGVQLCPQDDRCVAGEVLLEAHANGRASEARCEVLALSPATGVCRTAASN